MTGGQVEVVRSAAGVECRIRSICAAQSQLPGNRVSGGYSWLPFHAAPEHATCNTPPLKGKLACPGAQGSGPAAARRWLAAP